MDNILLIVAHEARDAANKFESLEDKITAAMKSACNAWITTNDDERFRGAIGGVLMCYKEDSQEYQRLKKEIEAIKKMSAFFNAANAGLTVDSPKLDFDFKPIGLTKKGLI